MRLLVLGGTGFLGPALVEAAVARGHDVTLFNRGRTGPDVFPELEHLRGDRPHDLAALARRTWDAVVDVPGTLPREVRASAELLAGAVEHYTLVSTISVYADLAEPPHEESRLHELDDPAAADRDEWSADLERHYGALKVLSERAVRELFADSALIVRPGLIVGPRDPTGRFTYWPHRLARGGRVLAPGDPARPVQFIDARDLGAWIVRMVEERRDGTFNATGRDPQMTMGEVLEECRRAAASDAELAWVADEFLLDRGVGEWMELPLWVASAEWRGLMAADISRAVAAGLRFRPLADTVAATLVAAAPSDGVGLSPDRERELLEAWDAR